MSKANPLLSLYGRGYVDLATCRLGEVGEGGYVAPPSQRLARRQSHQAKSILSRKGREASSSHPATPASASARPIKIRPPSTLTGITGTQPLSAPKALPVMRLIRQL